MTCKISQKFPIGTYVRFKPKSMGYHGVYKVTDPDPIWQDDGYIWVPILIAEAGDDKGRNGWKEECFEAAPNPNVMNAQEYEDILADQEAYEKINVIS